MTPLSAAVGGGLAGLAGAALAGVLTAALAGRPGPHVGLHGPVFNLALYSGLFYAAIGAAAGRRGRTAAIGFAGTFFGLLLALSAMDLLPRPTPHADIAVVLLYSAAIWGTIAALGASAARTTRGRGVAAAVIGSLAGYALLSVALKLAPALSVPAADPASLMPLPVNLLDGLLSGAGLCLALSLDERISWRPS